MCRLAARFRLGSSRLASLRLPGWAGEARLDRLLAYLASTSGYVFGRGPLGGSDSTLSRLALVLKVSCRRLPF